MGSCAGFDLHGGRHVCCYILFHDTVFLPSAVEEEDIMMKMFSESLTNKLCIVLGTGLVLILASLVDNYHYDALSRKGFFQKDFLYRSLGEARRLFSQYSFMTADIYLHGGFYPDDYDIVHKGTSPMHEQNGAGH